MKAGACFFILWLSGWGAACILFTGRVLFDGDVRLDNDGRCVMACLWLGEVTMLAYALWLFRSITTFTFHPDRLHIARSLSRFRREYTILKQDIRGVRQVKDGGEGEDTFPSWGLVVQGLRDVELLGRQDIEKSAWLGPIVAGWADVAYEPSPKQKD